MYKMYKNNSCLIETSNNFVHFNTFLYILGKFIKYKKKSAAVEGVYLIKYTYKTSFYFVFPTYSTTRCSRFPKIVLALHTNVY